MNVEVINEQCVGNCAKCTIHKNHPGFDYYSCVLNQIFQRNIALESKLNKLISLLDQPRANNLNQTIYQTANHEQEGMDDVSAQDDTEKQQQ